MTIRWNISQRLPAVRRHRWAAHPEFQDDFHQPSDLIEEVLVTNARKYSKGRVLRANRHVFGEGLLTSEGDFWLRQRRLAQPAFHRVRIASYAGTMVEYTQRMLDGWRGGKNATHIKR